MSTECIRGFARDVQHRDGRQMNPYVRRNEQICTFRIERHDALGNTLPFVSVEMRGYRFEGALVEGDEVEIVASWREGTTLKTKRARNVTLGVDVALK